jgi:hypothetical protein
MSQRQASEPVLNTYELTPFSMKLNFLTVLLAGALLGLGLALLTYLGNPGSNLADFMVMLGLWTLGVGALVFFTGLVLLFTPQRPLSGQLLLAGLTLVLVGFGTCAAFFTLDLR